jgi:hypothetical protein
MSAHQPTGFSEEIAADQPGDVYILETGIDAQTWIQLPDSGTLWVAYEYSNQKATAVFIWHQGGHTETVNLGFQTFNVNSGDALVYQVPSLSTMIKLGWAYIS